MTDHPTTVPAAQLTARQEQIVRLVAEGRTVAEIAQTMVVSAYTVKSHLVNAAKLWGARNRAHLIALAYQRGLLGAPAPGGAAAPASPGLEMLKLASEWHPDRAVLPARTAEYVAGYRRGVAMAQAGIRERGRQLIQTATGTARTAHGQAR